jgi:tellurite resistance protein TerC
MFFLKTENTDPNKNLVVRLTRRIFPVTSRYHGEHFFVRAGSPASHERAVPGSLIEADEAVAGTRAGMWMLTPLALALIMVETTDLVFAVDSIPAIFAITADPFLVFTSNVFAILGLRSLYFALAGLLSKFTFLKPALALVLLVVGVKMLTAKWLKPLVGEYFNFYLLGTILLILSAGVVASLLLPKASISSVEREVGPAA